MTGARGRGAGRTRRGSRAHRRRGGSSHGAVHAQGCRPRRAGDGSDQGATVPVGAPVSVVAVGCHAGDRRRGTGAYGLGLADAGAERVIRGPRVQWLVGRRLRRRRRPADRAPPGHPVGWIIAAAGMLAAADYASFEYALAAVVGHRDLPAGEYAGWSQLWIWVPFVALITACLPLLFPDGRLPGPRWRPAVWAAAGCGVTAATGLAITPGVVANLTALRNPLGVHPAAVPDTAIAAGLAGLLGCAVLAVWSLLVRARRGTSAERQQIKWLACAGCLVAATLAPSTILSQSTGTAARLAEGALMIAIVTVPAAVAVAVLRYRLYDINRVISRTLAYAIVTGLLAGIYAGLVLLATQVLRFSSPVAVAAATLAAAALFNPIRRRVQHAVDRRFNRARYDAQTTVAAFAARLKDAIDLDAVRGDLATVVQTALEPAHISIWTSQPDWSSRNPAGPVTSDVAVEVRAAGCGDNDSRITG